MKRTPEGVIDFNQFKKKKDDDKAAKALFTEPTIITLGDANDPDKQVQYLLLVNLVIEDKQILAMEEKDGDGQIVVVEALTENQDGEEVFTGVQMVQTEELYNQSLEILTQVFENQGIKVNQDDIVDAEFEEVEEDSDDTNNQ